MKYQSWLFKSIWREIFCTEKRTNTIYTYQDERKKKNEIRTPFEKRIYYENTLIYFKYPDYVASIDQAIGLCVDSLIRFPERNILLALNWARKKTIAWFCHWELSVHGDRLAAQSNENRSTGHWLFNRSEVSRIDTVTSTYSQRVRLSLSLIIY